VSLISLPRRFLGKQQANVIALTKLVAGHRCIALVLLCFSKLVTLFYHNYDVGGERLVIIKQVFHRSGILWGLNCWFAWWYGSVALYVNAV